MAPAGAFAAGQSTPLLTSDDVNFLITSKFLKRAPDRVAANLGDYQPRVVAYGVALDHVYVADDDAMECVLARAAAHKQNIARLFTEKVFLAGDGLSILLEGRSLADMAVAFDFHSPFPVMTALTDGGRARMTFLLVGQGKLVIGYDRPGTYHHPDPEYSVHGLDGYDLSRYIQMDLLGDGASRRSLSSLRVADAPGERLRVFLGPGDFAVERLTVMGAAVAVTISGRWSSVVAPFLSAMRPKPITARTVDPTRGERLERLGCPVDGRWGPPTPRPNLNPAFERAPP